MSRTKSILIACPQYRLTIRGTYGCDPDRTCPRGPGGEYILDHVRCSQYGGRCMQTLCALHRYNNRGPGSWYPAMILAMREPHAPQAKPQPCASGHKDPSGASTVFTEA